MSIKWLLPLIVAAAAGVAAFGIMRFTTTECGCGTTTCLEDVSFLSRELKLDDTQVQKIKALHGALGKRLDDCCARHCEARARLGQALARRTNDVDHLEAILADMCGAYEESERTTIEHIRRVRTILNASQRERFDKMIAECICAPCREHKHAPERQEDVSREDKGKDHTP
jgi:hypothetical protein